MRNHKPGTGSGRRTIQRTIRQGLREFDKLVARMEKAANVIDGPSAFRLYDTFGFPLEFTQELAEERGILLM